MNTFKLVFDSLMDSKIQKRVFWISERSEYKYAELTTNVNRIRALLADKGIKAGDRILVSLYNDFDMICVTIACLLNGVAVVLLEPDAKVRRTQTIIAAANIDGWFVDKKNVREWDLPQEPLSIAVEERQEKKGVLLNKLLSKKEASNTETLQSIISSYDDFQPIDDQPDTQPATIIFTSGTTSDPKGVILTHGNIIAHLSTLASHYQLDSQSVISNILPLYHVDGLFQGPFLSIFCKITLSRPFSFEIQRIEDLLHSIYKYKVTHFFSVPTMLTLIEQFGKNLDDSFDSPEFRYVISVAGYLEENLWKRFMDVFKVRVCNVYGLTETVAGGFFCGPGDDCWKVGTIGKPVDSEIKIVDKNGNTCASDEVGELVIKGEHVMPAYLVADGNPDEAGWFRTGDLACVDKDGFYAIKGRIKNVIIKGGINIYPEELSAMLNLHLDIEESYIFGKEDETWGERVVAVIRKPMGSEISAKQIKEYCKDVMEQEKVPDEIFFLDELPKGLSGKIARDQVLKKLEEEQTFQKTELREDESVQMKLLKIATECFNYPITKDELNAPSQTISGWNSLAHLEFATKIEKAFNIQLSTKAILNIVNISSAEAIVMKKKMR